MLRLADAWVWDCWLVDHDGLFHAFYLKASRALLDPERRHGRPEVGHSVSTDLRAWEELPDSLVHSDGPAFDEQGIWTGSVIRDDEGLWHMFFTGIDREGRGRVQRIGHAVSTDLLGWSRISDAPIVVADERWYETDATHGRENWRDPWVFREGSNWRMLITAHGNLGPESERGCIATAVSTDLEKWTVEAPLASQAGLRQLEVLQLVECDGQYVVVFCLCAADVHAEGLPRVTGTWSAPADSLTGPFHLDRAEPIAVEGNYAGRVINDRSGTPCLLAFVDVDARGEFGGYLGDPVPLALTERGTLQPLSSRATAIFRGEQ
jgi:beta-fructofuranosidase